MSDKEQIILFDKILKGTREAQRALYKRKAKLGEDVVIADGNGQPLVIPASEALKRLEMISDQ